MEAVMNTMNVSEEMKYSEDQKRKKSGFKVKDPWSAFTHFIGFVASITAAPFLLIRVKETNSDLLMAIGCILFLLGLISLYGASTSYHTFALQGKHQYILKKYDHMMIFILIAGSYSPYCLGPLRDNGGVPLLIVIWSMAILGMIFNLCWITCPKWVSSVLYIIMGWLVIVTLPQLISELSHLSLFMLVGGGIAYTIGGLIYAIRFKKFNEKHPSFGTHEIFHVFCLIGSFCHFLSIYNLM